MPFRVRSLKAIDRWRRRRFGTRSNESFVFLFFLCVSFGFWLLQALNETQEQEVQIGLELHGVPDDVIILDSLPPTVSVTIRDKGLTLARHSISSFFQPLRLTLDFKRYVSTDDYADIAITPYEMQRMLARKFNATTNIQSFRPDTLHLAYNHGRSRLLPLRLNTSLRAQRQNYIQSVRPVTDSVRVYAPAFMLDTMQAVYTEPLVADELQESTVMTAIMKRRPHVKYVPAQTSVQVSVGYYTEKTVSVPVKGTNFPADKKLRTFPSRVTLTFRVESGRYQQITASDFILTTTYEELLATPANSKLLLQLKHVPEGVADVRISPQEVDYLIEQNINVEEAQ